MFYSKEELYHNKHMKGLSGTFHVTQENAKLFYLSLYQVESGVPSWIEKMAAPDLIRERAEYENLHISEETEEKWRDEIYYEVRAKEYRKDTEFGYDYLHLVRFLDTKEKKNDHFLSLSDNLLRFTSDDCLFMEFCRTISRMFEDPEIDTENKISVMESISKKRENIPESKNFGSLYVAFLEEFIPAVALAEPELDPVLQSMIPSDFQYITSLNSNCLSTLCAYLLGICGIEKNYLKAYEKLEEYILIRHPDKARINQLIASINRRSNMNYTYDDVMSSKSNVSSDEVYFANPDLHITMDNAKRYFRYMGCSFMHMFDVSDDHCHEFSNLKIPFDILTSWAREYLLEKLHSVNDDENFVDWFGGFFSIVCLKEDTMAIFERTRNVCEKKGLTIYTIQHVLDYDIDDKTLSGLCKGLLANGMREELCYVSSYVEKWLSEHEKEGPFERLSGALEILNAEIEKMNDTNRES